MLSAAAVKAFADIDAATAVLNAEVDRVGEGASSGGDPLRESSDDCLDILSGTARREGMLSAVKARAAARFAGNAEALAGPGASVQAVEMSVAAEIGCLLGIGRRAGGAFLFQSRVLDTVLPLTLAALAAGTFSWQHARVMVDETACLDAAGVAALEGHFLDPAVPDPARGCPAGEMIPSRFRARARAWRERHQPGSIEARHTKSVLDRRVEYVPDVDGMAWLSAYLPADTAEAIWNRMTAISRGLQGPGEDRSLTQLRADVFATALLTTGTGTGSGSGTVQGAGDGVAGDGLAEVPWPRAEVAVTVPVFSLMGLTDEPGELAGYGPIPASMARDLVANGAGSFYRVLVDPRDGAPLEMGRKRYRLTKAMRRWLRLRDGRCSFPGCSNQSLDNDADHVLAWADGGATGVSNLEELCPAHHRLKHASAWTPAPASKDEPPGWISPTGRRYRSEQRDWEPPQWPKGLSVGGGGQAESAGDSHQPLPPPETPSDPHAYSGPRRPSMLGGPSNSRRPVDLVHSGQSPGEAGLEKFLRAHA